METCDLTKVLSSFNREFQVQIARTPESIVEAHRFRYKVFCEERKYAMRVDDGMEFDAFDEHSRHVIVRRRDDAEVIAAVRLIMPSHMGERERLPIETLCNDADLAGLPLQRMAEVSRFAVSKARKSSDRRTDGLLRLGLLQGGMRFCWEAGLTHVCAVMKTSLLRLLRGSAIHFNPIGDPITFHGLRQPCFAQIDSVLARVRRERPLVWNLIMDSPQGFAGAGGA